MKINIDKDWEYFLQSIFDKPYFEEIINKIDKLHEDNRTFYPENSQIFAAFNNCPLSDLKIVILGQDPYHGIGQANGLSFSVPDGLKIPPSLQNIYKELKTDIGFEIPSNGNLLAWASKGVLLLNSVLTVFPHLPRSHQKMGWQQFTDDVIKKISNEKEGIVFLLWGNYAKQKQILIDPSKHLILTAAHPSPFSAHKGFNGCKHFSKANAYLVAHGIKPVDWNL